MIVCIFCLRAKCNIEMFKMFKNGYYINIETGKEVFLSLRKKILIVLGVVIGGLLIAYLSIAIFFVDRFYFGTIINDVNCTGKTVKVVEELLKEEGKDYELEVIQREGKVEKIKAEDIDYKVILEEDIQLLKKEQNAWLWVLSAFNKEKYEVETSTVYDYELLNACFMKLSCLDKKKMTPPIDAYAEYGQSGYVLVKAKTGNTIKSGVLKGTIMKSIREGKKSLSLEAFECYENPKYTEKSYEMKELVNTLRRYTDMQITYRFGDRTEVLTGQTIHKWLKVDSDLEVCINEDEVENYVKTLAEKYDTLYSKRQFQTSRGAMVDVVGGCYGWKLDVEREKLALIKNIKQGFHVIKEPIYSQKGVCRDKNDIGTTYVEVDLTGQHMWFYKAGKLMVETDIVTGNVKKKCATPAGTFFVSWKSRNRTLKGPGYSSFVNYWMAINGGVGIHDAKWRGKFGGNIYKTNGSHGCINTPFSKVKEIYDNIEVGIPVICYQ